MKIQPHPFIARKLVRLFIVTFIAFWLLYALAVYGDRYIANFEAHHYFLIIFSAIWSMLIYFFITVWLTLKRVNCPHCHQKAVTQSHHEALPDHHSAYCPACDILWDLGIGNSTSD